jgi:hypothetical protein
MAIQTTFTASEWTQQPREMPSGVLAKTATLTLSTTATASSIMLLLKVPDGATIIDFMFFIESGGANGTWDLGLQIPEGSSSWTLTQSAISPAQSDSPSALCRPIGVNLPMTVSISSECPQRWAWVTAVNSAAVSASAVMRMTVFYTMDGA